MGQQSFLGPVFVGERENRDKGKKIIFLLLKRKEKKMYSYPTTTPCLEDVYGREPELMSVMTLLTVAEF